MLYANYHTHTRFCDGAEHPLKYAEEALIKNLSALGFSAHASLPFQTKWTVPKGNLIKYHDAISELKVQIDRKLEIYCGLELDYIPTLWDSIKALSEVGKWDYIIGSIHFVDSFADGSPWTIDGGNDEFRKGFSEVFDNNSHLLIKKYFEYTREMVRVMKPDIIGHIDKLKMQHTPGCFVPDNDPVFRQELSYTLDEIAAAGCIIEINTRGVYRRNEAEFYPGLWAIKEMAKRNIPVVVNSDAHKPEEIIHLHDKALRTLYDSGYRKVKILYKGEWQEQAI